MDWDANDYYVYLLTYPSGRVFYVGKGRGYRVLDHEREARKGVQSIKCNIIRSIWDNGGQVLKEKPFEHLTAEEARDVEWRLLDKGGPFLSNINSKGGAFSFDQWKQRVRVHASRRISAEEMERRILRAESEMYASFREYIKKLQECRLAGDLQWMRR